MKRSLIVALMLGCMTRPVTVGAQVVAPTGYIYAPQLLSSITQSCVAVGPGGTFVGVGPGFTANAQAVVFAKESGDARLVAFGFNSIGDCAYDAAADALYISDNADNTDLGLSGPTAAQSGDTVFLVAAASTASAISATDAELLPADSVPFASALAVDATGDVLIANSASAAMGSILKLDIGPTVTSSTLVPGLSLPGGVAIDPATGNLFVASAVGFDAQIQQFTAAGAAVPPDPFTGPSSGFGSYDLAFNSDGSLLATGDFGGDVVSFAVPGGTSTSFIGGLNFATGVTVNGFTGRVEVLSSTFLGGDEDKSIHRFVPVDHLVAGGGSSATDCLHELYGAELVGDDAVCIDGAACDADGTVNDRCLFPIGFCLNVSDPTLNGCTANAALSEVSVTAKPASSAIDAAAAAVSAALPLTEPACFFSDGLSVPVKITGSGKKQGKGKIKVKAESADGNKDSDTVKLLCDPAP